MSGDARESQFSLKDFRDLQELVERHPMIVERVSIARDPDNPKCTCGPGLCEVCTEELVRASIVNSVIINGKIWEVGSSTICYREVVGLAGFPMNSQPSVTYHKADDSKADGVMLPNTAVAIKTGTVFNVADTSNA